MFNNAAIILLESLSINNSSTKSEYLSKLPCCIAEYILFFILSCLFLITFFISGIFFSVETLPETFRDIALVNPLLHLLELIRVSFFPTFTSPYANVGYIIVWIISLNLLGLWLYSRLERRIIAS
ncbi:MAG: hypothetical protein EOM23_08205 [Candidatus Moranbacteria bacterium]|nr:hypothetical protein [Candidatus Moranbacteria bacterium]